MKNASIKSLKSLCVFAKCNGQELYFCRDYGDRWYVALKCFGYTRSYCNRDFIHFALVKACTKYGVEWRY